MRVPKTRTTHSVRLEESVLEVLEQVLELELADLGLVALKDRDAEPEDGLDALGKNEVEHGRDELEREAVPSH